MQKVSACDEQYVLLEMQNVSVMMSDMHLSTPDSSTYIITPVFSI
jgi:hypothetical protein